MAPILRAQVCHTGAAVARLYHQMGALHQLSAKTTFHPPHARNFFFSESGVQGWGRGLLPGPLERLGRSPGMPSILRSDRARLALLKPASLIAMLFRIMGITAASCSPPAKYSVSSRELGGGGRRGPGAKCSLGERGCGGWTVLIVRVNARMHTCTPHVVPNYRALPELEKQAMQFNLPQGSTVGPFGAVRGEKGC